MGRSRSFVVATDDDLIVLRDPERPSGRLLRQGDMDASYVDLADAGHLEFDYLRWTRLTLRAMRARRVLHVGGAACTLARALLAEDRESRQQVVEADVSVLEIARAHLGLRRQPGLKVRVGDGRQVVSTQADSSFDAIVIDAFVGARVPRHLVTAEALADCARVAPLTLINVVDAAAWSAVRSIAAGLAGSYVELAALSSGSRARGNVVLFATNSSAPYGHLERAAAADRSPARLLRRIDLGGGAAWHDGAVSGVPAEQASVQARRDRT